jgi:hypothetical protein
MMSPHVSPGVGQSAARQFVPRSRDRIGVLKYLRFRAIGVAMTVVAVLQSVGLKS